MFPSLSSGYKESGVIRPSPSGSGTQRTPRGPGGPGRREVWDAGGCGPKATIQAGIDATADSDVVIVGDGVYTGAGNMDLDLIALADINPGKRSVAD